MDILSQELTLYRGDSKEIFVSMVDEEGVGIDFAGAEDIIWVLSKNASPTTTAEIVKKKSDATLTVTDVGEFKVNLRHEDTKDLKGKYLIECRLVNGEVNTTIIRGVAEVLESIIVAKSLI